MGKLKIIVLGIVGRTPFAGVAWQAMHYLEGLRRLGHDVYYIEDTQSWCMDLSRGTITDDCSYTLAYLDRLMRWMDFGGRWGFKAASQNDRVFGISELQFNDLFRDADVLINLCGSTQLRDIHRQVPLRVYLETDPGAPQLGLAEGHQGTLEFLSDHNVHFTFAENIQHSSCRLPPTEFEYHTTRQPVVSDWWQIENPVRLMPDYITTVASWKQSGRDVTYRGETYTWSKHHRFEEFLDLPERTTRPCGMALACGETRVIGRLVAHGWQVVDATRLTSDILPYRDFIAQSYCEFTVAKDQYARTRSGWFSDRSASYLAAGRPVITEETGFGVALPTGEGLFAFRDLDDILDALAELERDYPRHRAAAFEIGREYFEAEKVLSELLQKLESAAQRSTRISTPHPVTDSLEK